MNQRHLRAAPWTAAFLVTCASVMRAAPAPKTSPRLAAAAARRSAIEAARAGRWAEARPRLEQALNAEPDQPEALYALAICRAHLRDPAAALQALTAALQAGFQDYHSLETDPALAPLRVLPAFEKLVEDVAARRERFDEELAAGARESYRSTALEVRRFADARLVVVTDLGSAVAERLAASLGAVESRQRRGLFLNGLRHAIVVQATKPAAGAEGRIPGLYAPASRTLQVNIAVPAGAMVREFVRALHYDDQAAFGQVHAAWLRAGIAALYERTDPGTGEPRAVLDWRLDPLRVNLGGPSYVALARLLIASDRALEAGGIGEARYLLYWLQQTGKLVAFYRSYIDRYDEDPSGRQALEAAQGAPLASIEQQWLAYLRGPIPGP